MDVRLNGPDGKEDIAKLLQRGKQMSEAGRYDESNELYFTVLERKEALRDPYAVYSDIADNCGRLGKRQEAIRWLTKCLELRESPNRIACAHAQIAVSESYLGNREAELKHCLAALPLFDKRGKDYDPQCEYHMLDMLGLLSLQNGDPASAERYLRRGVAVHDRHADKWKKWGLRHLQLYPYTMGNLGEALLRQGKVDRAVRVLKRALECQRTRVDNFLIFSSLGRAYYDKQDFATAASYLEQAVQNAEEGLPTAVEHYLLGCCYASVDAHEKALANYLASLGGEIVFREGPVQRVEIYRAIAEEMYSLGRKEEGEEWYQKAYAESDDVAARKETMKWEARSLARCGKTQAAIDLCRECAEAAESKIEKAGLYYEIAVTLWNAREFGRCKEWLEKSLRVHRSKEARNLLQRTRPFLRSRV